MIEQLANAITAYAFYTASKQGKVGLTVTVDVYEGTNDTPIVSGGSATELGGGLYYYTLTSGSVDAVGEYIFIFKTTDTTVDQQHIPALWTIGRAGVENLDASISSRSDFDEASDTVDLGKILGTALTETVSGYLAAAFKKLFDVASPVLTAEESLAALPWNSAWDAEVQSEVNDALVALNLDHLAAVADDDDVVDNAILAKMAASDGDWSGFNKTVAALEALRAKLNSLGTTVTVQSSSVVTDGVWEFYTHDTIVQTVTGLGDITGYKAVWVTLKKKDTDPDPKAILFFSSDVGLEVLNKSDDVTAGDAAVTVDDASVGNITMKLEIGVSSKIAPDEGVIWGIKWKDADDEVHTLLDSTSNIKAGPVKATS
jgi:hypothetical protein